MLIIIVAIVAVALLTILPFLGNPFATSLLITTFGFVAMASGYNILGGYTGRVNFGYGAFYGLGAYFTMILAKQLSVQPELMIPAAVVIIFILALLLGVPLLRLKGIYFAIGMITFLFVCRYLMLLFPEITGGGKGLMMYTAFPHWGYYLIALFTAVGMTFLSYKIKDSTIGLAARSINQDEDAADSLGINTTKYKVYTFAISIVPAAIVGGYMAPYMSFIQPNTYFTILMSITVVLMCRVGGLGTVTGPVVGALVIQGVGYVFRFTLPGATHKIVWGLMLALVVLIMPRGIINNLRDAEWVPSSIKEWLI